MTPPPKKKELEVQDSGNVSIVSFTRAKILDDQVILYTQYTDLRFGTSQITEQNI